MRFVRYHGMVSIGRKLYIFGGCAASGRQNDLWAFDIDKNFWESLPSEGGPSPRGGPAVVATEKEIYVFFGKVFVLLAYLKGLMEVNCLIFSRLM